ncbi:MAG: hypothetical protein JW822_11240 [Spirochaetales bacterium]|nr:hypothetical protein [Spirochaetales bacterium]
MYKRTIVFLIFACILLAGGSAQAADQAELIINNMNDYVDFSFLSVNFNWQFDTVDWDHGKSYHYIEIEKLENKHASDPDDLSACIKLLYLYELDQLEDQADLLAGECKKRFELGGGTSAFTREEQAVLNAQIIFTKKDKKNYQNALQALFPFLNSGTALKQDYIIALNLSLGLQQYELAVKLADACVAAYPDDPDVYFKRFDTVIMNNIVNWIQYIHTTTKEQFTQDQGVKEITKENYKEFEEIFFTNLHTQLGMKDIEKVAQEFADDYRITMKTIGYKLMISYWTRFMITAMCASQDMEDQEIMDMMFHSNSSELFDFSPYFDNALRTRPKRDVQVFCALFVYYFQQNNLEKAEEYAQQILTLRPDMYLGYNALIFIECITNMDKMNSDDYSFDTQREMYLTKIKNTGGEDTDYVFLISDCIKKYHSASKQEKKMLTAQIENYLEKLFAVNQQSEWGIFMQGNYYMLTVRFTEAIESYNKIEESENQDIRKSLFNNRAAAKILTGDGTGARRDLDQSLKIDPDKEESLKLLELLDAK